ncbi:alanine or glycine:cation symporter, AGCS family [Ekhidna lutea]|uniref:Alanine or glycine:cation symporter, AGCS family n=1 Tax=Ekhidna lutea TaxID=447679 RepID=A0A239KR07_EKHLU|nr:amino acid carrier protein [Ekhidna lutea]SNT20460.1 alanine or glycine:cation symporter, AGCS family [Ekhidna lutea]
MRELNEILNQIDGAIGGSSWFVYLLLGTGLFFTIYLKFPQIRYFRFALRVVKGKFDKADDEGDASHFQALATALSGTVGTGNIGGVALAVHLGGPAALFWMLVTAMLGMTTKFVEVTLSHKYREKVGDGISGGPMYYMKKRLNITTKSGKVIKTGYFMGGLFAIATIMSSFGTGNLPQINNIANSVFTTFGVEQWITGAVLAVLLAAVILGGIKRIVKVTEKIVPFMAVVYLLGALSVIFYNAENIFPSILAIFGDVFTGSAAMGGFLGANLAFAFNRGVNRGLFSNEAGQGSAPIAHSAARAHEPVSEGMVAILEPFIDTIIICTITGLVLLSSGAWAKKYENEIQYSDIVVLADVYDEADEDDKRTVRNHMIQKESVPLFSGNLNVEEGIVQNGVTIIAAESFAENVKIRRGDKLYSGTINVLNGSIAGDSDVTIIGKSLLHSAPLTTVAFNEGYFGDYGKYIVSIGLILFAFSTAISWSYYGGRATTYLFGTKYIIVYKIIYVAGFFVASFADTTIIWTLANITIALMTIPNLIGILIMHREMKQTVGDYWKDFKLEWPNEKTPE